MRRQAGESAETGEAAHAVDDSAQLGERQTAATRGGPPADRLREPRHLALVADDPPGPLGHLHVGQRIGALVAHGTQEQVAAKAETSYTGAFLAEIVKPAGRRKRRGARAKVPAAA